MTDQKYKLVPVEPTQDMIEWVQAACVEHLSPREAYDIAKTLVAHVPEPVCRWKGGEDADYVVTDCGEQLLNDGPYPFPFCPHCGKRVQLREEVDDEIGRAHV